MDYPYSNEVPPYSSSCCFGNFWAETDKIIPWHLGVCHYGPYSCRKPRKGHTNTLSSILSVGEQAWNIPLAPMCHGIPTVVIWTQVLSWNWNYGDSMVVSWGPTTIHTRQGSSEWVKTVHCCFVNTLIAMRYCHIFMVVFCFPFFSRKSHDIIMMPWVGSIVHSVQGSLEWVTVNTGPCHHFMVWYKGNITI